MVKKMKQYAASKRFRLIILAAVSCAFMLSGFGMASASLWKGISGTSTLVSAPQASPAVPVGTGSLADLAKELSPTVVNIKVTKVEKAGHFSMPAVPEGPFGRFFEQFPDMVPQSPDIRPIQGAGSGVIISTDGYILTNNHVVEGAREVTVTLADKQEYTAEIIGRDPKTDLAVLKIKPKDSLRAATMGDSEQLRVGDSVMAVGNPFGLGHTVTAGIVSAKGRVIGAGPYDNFIQTDASINPGNSGGPLYNMQGELVGINTAIIPYGQGIGFAVPINTAKPLIPQLIARGQVTRGYLGVTIQSLTPELAKGLGLEASKGALVADVVAGSPAERAGIQRGDVVVSYNEKAVGEARDLSAMVAETPVGQGTTITVLRNGAKHDLDVKIGSLQSEKSKEEPTIHPASDKWGLLLQDLDSQVASRFGVKDGQGVAVVGVKSGTPAERAGIHEGDVILEVNRHQVHSVKEAKEAIVKSKSADALLLLVQRESGRLYVALTA
jgi:serine protease Do